MLIPEWVQFVLWACTAVIACTASYGVCRLIEAFYESF